VLLVFLIYVLLCSVLFSLSLSASLLSALCSLVLYVLFVLFSDLHVSTVLSFPLLCCDVLSTLPACHSVLFCVFHTFSSSSSSSSSSCALQLNPTSSKAAYRRGLVRNFFYRFFLQLRGAKTAVELRSGAELLPRGLSSGSQTFKYDEAKHAPVSKPLPKLSARSQAAGTSQYTDDIPLKEGTQFAALVTSTVAHGKLVGVDASCALAMDGVMAVVTHKDIRGKNNVSPVPWPLEALVSDKVGAQGLPIAIVVASSTRLAEQAAKLVQVKYDLSEAEPLVITARQAAEAGEKQYIAGAVNTIGDAEVANKALNAAKHKQTLEVEIGSQAHFYMEPLVAYAVPEEDNGMVVYAGCQWPDACHTAISGVLGVPVNCVRFIHRRCGGGFGVCTRRDVVMWCFFFSCFCFSLLSPSSCDANRV
jgi:Aldehyde oxidase and xanthine dehydrogenase, a/b hammerhead domain/Molybdopterin cofactor-binding domain